MPLGEAFLTPCYCPDGQTDGNQKCPLIFFIFRYIKHYTHIYLNVYKKVVLTNVLWVLNFGQVGGPDAKIQKHPLGWIFFNHTKSSLLKGFLLQNLDGLL